MPDENKLPDLTEVLWMCRRGMLELDLVLNNFARQEYVALDSNMKKQFITLLTYDDPVLFDILIKKSIAADDKITNIVTVINTYSGTASKL